MVADVELDDDDDGQNVLLMTTRPLNVLPKIPNGTGLENCWPCMDGGVLGIIWVLVLSLMPARLHFTARCRGDSAVTLKDQSVSTINHLSSPSTSHTTQSETQAASSRLTRCWDLMPNWSTWTHYKIAGSKWNRHESRQVKICVPSSFLFLHHTW